MKIKNCPRCGSDKLLWAEYDQYYLTNFYLNCNVCNLNSLSDTDKEAIVMYWNNLDRSNPSWEKSVADMLAHQKHMAEE